ncbi:MAG: hypothetical protein ACTSQ5_05505 [Promethearchaeota archaeon]
MLPKIDLSSFDFKKISFEDIYWIEILQTGTKIRDEIKEQIWSYLYTNAWDIFDRNILSDEEEEYVKSKCDEFIISKAEVKLFITEKSVDIKHFLLIAYPDESIGLDLD